MTLCSRKGMWTQIFLIMFFVLLLVIAVILLTLEKGRLATNSKFTEANENTQFANAALISLLRTPTTFTADGKTVTAPIADVIIMNFEGKYDDAIFKAIEANYPKDHPMRMTIRYGWGRVMEIGIYFSDGKPAEVVSNEAYVVPDTWDGMATLPGQGGNIVINMYVYPARAGSEYKVITSVGGDKAPVPEKTPEQKAADAALQRSQIEKDLTTKSGAFK